MPATLGKRIVLDMDKVTADTLTLVGASVHCLRKYLTLHDPPEANVG
jgi:hypothetical protein